MYFIFAYPVQPVKLAKLVIMFNYQVSVPKLPGVEKYLLQLGRENVPFDATFIFNPGNVKCVWRDTKCWANDGTRNSLCMLLIHTNFQEIISRSEFKSLKINDSFEQRYKKTTTAKCFLKIQLN